MALLSVIRRWHDREGMSIREIVKRTGLARNTIRKYLANNVVEPRYPRRKSPSKLDDYEEVLNNRLHQESKRSRKQRKNLKTLHAELVAMGYAGSYDRVAAYAREWRQIQQEAQRTASKHTYVPLSFAPGEAFQFDWSEDHATIKGVKTKLQIAHTKLSYSRAFILRAYPQQTHEMLFDAHTQAFRVLGGIAERGIYDNMKTAIDKMGRGKERVINKRFLAMTSHYLFEPDFCNAASGWEKGQVEKNVQDSRHRLWQGAPDFSSLDDLNIWLEVRCQAYWKELPHPEQKLRTIHDCWQEEREHLMPMPTAFDGFIEHTKRVTSTCLIHFDRNRYSVPASFANRPISLRVYPERLVIVAEGNVVAEHARVMRRNHDEPGKTIYDWRHYLAVVQRKPGALRNGAPFLELPECFRRLQAILLKRRGGDREMADILALVLLHDEQLVEQAVEAALQSDYPTKQHVLNCLSRLNEPQRPEPVMIATVLRLNSEPLANTARYDALREHLQ